MEKARRTMVVEGGRLGRCLVRLSILWLTIGAAGGVFSERGVEASEGGELEIPGLGKVRSEIPRARVVTMSPEGRLEVLRQEGEYGELLTVVTGFPCDRARAACALVEYGSFAEAAAVFRQRIDSGEDDAAARCALGNALFLKGDLLGAARAYAWAATGYPQNPDIRNGMANVLTELGQYRRAVEEYQLLGQQPGYAAVARNNLGNAYLRMERLQEALQEYELALTDSSQMVAARYNRAGTLLSLGRHQEAADSFREVAHRAKNFAEAYLYQGLSHLRDQQSILAAAALYRARELGLDTPVLHLALGMALQEEGMDAEAISHLQRALTEDSGDEKIYQILAMSLIRMRRFQEAARALEQGFFLGAQDADAHFLLGLKLFLCEHPAGAVRHFMMAAAKGRRGADTFFGLGQALFMSGEIESAVRSLSLAARLNPRAPEVHFALGVALFHEQDLPGAIRELKTAAALGPGDVDSRLVLMDLYRHAGEFDLCADSGKQILDLDPELVVPRFETAFCQALAGELQQAIETMEDALDHDLEGQEIFAVWKRLEQLAARSSDLPGPYLLLAVIHQRRGNWSDALQAWEKFILRAPSRTWAREAMVRILELVPPPESGSIGLDGP